MRSAGPVALLSPMSLVVPVGAVGFVAAMGSVGPVRPVSPVDPVGSSMWVSYIEEKRNEVVAVEIRSSAQGRVEDSYRQTYVSGEL